MSNFPDYMKLVNNGTKMCWYFSHLGNGTYSECFVIDIGDGRIGKPNHEIKTYFQILDYKLPYLEIVSLTQDEYDFDIAPWLF